MAASGTVHYPQTEGISRRMDAQRILVVDDEDVIRELAADVLRGEGFEVEGAGSAEEAMRKLRSARFDLVLTDVRMPGKDGLELIREIKCFQAETVCMVMTAYPTLEAARATVREGAYDYVLKPFDLAEIRGAVQRALERKALFDENARLRELARLLEVTRSITGCVDADRLPSLLLDLAIAEGRGTKGLVVLEEDVGGVVLRASHGVGAGVAEWVQREEMQRFLKGLAEEEGPLLLGEGPDIFSEIGGSDGETMTGRRPEGGEWLWCPLKAGTRSLGLLAVGTAAEQRFRKADQEVLTILADQGAVALENARLLQQARESLLSTVVAFAAAIDAKDAYTHNHSRRVGDLAVRLGTASGLPSATIECLRYAGLLHDIGKIGVAGSVLRKEGSLGAEEWRQVRQHPAVGAHIVEHIPSLRHLVPAIRYHHERFDGTGYPEGLAGEEIPIAARILAIADAFEAMSSDRAYRAARFPEEIVRQLREGAGTQFDPELASLFFRLLEEDPEAFRNHDQSGGGIGS
jgi:response regulator RpfG family c-di-GMP phosphodiesterase